MRFLITGGAGFIGSNFIRHLIAARPSASVVNLDALTYAAAPVTIAEQAQLPRYRLVQGDICDEDLVEQLVADADIVVNFAAESHVDRSIAGPGVFVRTNVLGTTVLLDAARRHGVERFIHVSTDEVYGPVLAGAADEQSQLNPSSPYAASKASADLLVGSYRTTYGYPAIITRCSNNYGPYQHPEKFIPLATTRLLANSVIPLYGDGMQERDWLWVEDHCSALGVIVDRGTAGEVYNISSGTTVTNREIAERLLELTGRGQIGHVPDRPGHDRRYAIESAKIRSLGWEPVVDLDEGLARTVGWYDDRADWWSQLVASSS